MYVNEVTRERFVTETVYELAELSRKDLETILYCLDYSAGDIPGYYDASHDRLEQAIRQALE